jgi:hypothetical protein
LKNRVCLSRGLQVASAAWRVVTRVVAGVGDLVQRTGDGRTGQVLSGWAIERSDGTVCGLHRARGDKERWFLGSASQLRSTVCEWFGLKTTRSVSSSLASKPAATVSNSLASKSVATVFSSLASKLVVMVSLDLTTKPVVGFLVEPQNQGGGGFPGLGLKTGTSGLVSWASKSPRRFLGLDLKIKHASVSQLRHKTNGGRSVRDTHRDLA